MRREKKFAILLAVALLATSGAQAKGWDKISKEEREMTSVDWYPQAPAVVLFHHTSIVLSDSREPQRRNEHIRLKILTEEGKSYGTVSVLSSEVNRLSGLDARVVLPNKKVIPLPQDAVFEKEYSTYYDAQITSLAMPGVEVGAIVEWRYSMSFDNPFVMWEVRLQNELPMLHREVVFVKPSRYEFTANFEDPYGREPLRTVNDTGAGLQVTYVMKELPPLPDEPYRPPYADLASRVQFVPAAVASRYHATEELARTWESLTDIFEKYAYSESRKKAQKVRSEARQRAAAGGTPVQKTEILYTFVRDEIANEQSGDAGTDRSLDEILKERQGTMAEKALLLQVMLEEAGIESTLAWTNPRRRGKMSKRVPHLNRVNKVLVAASLDGERVFLDASRPDLAFGHLEPDLEGVNCLLLTGSEEAEWVTLPERSHEESRRIADLNLALDTDGHLAGNGTLSLTGYHAWRYLMWQDTPEATTTAWTGWLGDRFPGFVLGDVQVEESVAETTVSVTWKMEQRAEEVLGDEAVLNLAAPLGLDVSPFTLALEDRNTAVHLPFRDSEEVRLQVSWPEMWEIDVAPQLRDFKNWAGELATEIEIDEEGRSLTTSRRFDLVNRDVRPTWVYSDLRKLFEACVENDAETLVLVKNGGS